MPSPSEQADARPDPRQRTAADLMTAGPRTCSPFSTVTEAAMIFRDADCGAVPVMDEGKPVGILTDRDVALAASAFPDLLIRPVSDIMTRDVVTITADAPLDAVEAKFGESRVRRLLVVDAEGQLVGIVAWADLAARLPEQEVGHVVAEVVGRPGPDADAAKGGADRVGPAGTVKPASARPGAGSSWADPATFWALLKEAGGQWMGDRAPRLGAALAYYSIFSLAPLLLIAIAVAGLIFGKKAAQGQILGQLRSMIGSQGAEAVEAMLASASKPGSGYAATGIGVVLLLVGAMGLFGQLQDAMDTVWEVQPKPGRGVMGLLKDRLLSLSMVMGTVFLLLTSLVVSALLAGLSGLLGEWASGGLGQVVSFVVSLGVFAGLFAMIYRFLPDARVAWRDVWLGAAVTALLFDVGKTAIGLYIGHSGVATAYGAAGSVVVLLVWAYYSAQIFLFGAEFTKAFANRFGSRIEPKPGAERVTQEARADQGMERRPAGVHRG